VTRRSAKSGVGLSAAPQGSGTRLIGGDWLDVVSTLEDGSVDLLYADPPFNTGRKQAGRAGSYEDRWPGRGEYIDWLESRLRATLPKLKASASVLLHVDYRVSHLVRVMLDEVLGEDRFVNHLIWSYGLGGSSPRRFARKHDDILFYCVEPEAYWFEPPRVKATSRRMKGQTKKATDVLDVASINNMAAERTGYPTQKPLELLRLLVKACCPPGGMVLDPCCGSGTTLVAAALEGRRAVGVDRNPEAIAVSLGRLRALPANDVAKG
jgi:site-specific DNA-methyltransferase (adenine-specific)